MRHLVALPLLSLLALSLPTSATAQGCDLYPVTGCGNTIADHKTVSGGAGGGDPHPDRCIYCMDPDTEEGTTPDHCHPCGFIGGGEGDAYVQLLSAIQGEDLHAVLLLAPRVPSRILLNNSRSSLQVYSCDGTAVVAQFPLSGPQLAAVALSYALTQEPVAPYAFGPIGPAVAFVSLKLSEAPSDRL